MGRQRLPCRGVEHRTGVLIAALGVAGVTLVGASVAARRDAGNYKPAHRQAVSGREYKGDALVLRIYFRPLPRQMPGSTGDTPEQVALGRRLFFERGISLNKSQSCNDCHRLDGQRAGADRIATSRGATGTFGKRNSPTVLNAGFQIAQFWDGRAADLLAQAKGPVLNPVEMGMRTPEDVADRLNGDEGYRRAFGRAFPDQAEPVTFDNVARAIAAFERTLIAPARFDRYLKGETRALTREEKRGLQRFMDTGCLACHNSHPVGGRTLQQLGIYHPYRNRQDQGRYDVTKLEEDRFVFKVPMLRNVTLTAPYFHDGQVAALAEAVRLMTWMQLDTKLSAGEINDIADFLHALETEHPAHFEMP